MKTVLFAALLALSVSASVDTTSTNAPFSLPPGVKIVAHDESGKTWRQSGRAAGAVSDVRHAFSNAVARGGFVCRHVIRMDEKGEHVLEEWKRHDVQLMLMFWSAEGGKTMFSWGTFHE